MMKRLRKTITLALLGMALPICLGMKDPVTKHSGTFSRPATHTYEGCEIAWEVDTISGTLTIEVPDMGKTRASFDMNNMPWKHWEEDIQKIILWGNGYFPGLQEDIPENERTPFAKSIRRMPLEEISSFWGNGFSWVYTPRNKTLTYYGNGTEDINSVDRFAGWNPEQLKPETVVLADDYIGIVFYNNAPKLVISETVKLDAAPGIGYYLEADYVEVSEENPFYCSYDGAIYSKDGSRLLYSKNREMKFHPNLRSIEAYSLNLEGGTLVIPWRVERIDHSAFNNLYNIEVILPDTVTSIEIWLSESKWKGQKVIFRFSPKNAMAGLVQWDAIPQYLDIVDSVIEYYPDVPEA